MQTQLKMTGTFNPCRCGKQPKFYEWRREYFGECSPCGIRTPRVGSKTEAVQLWEESNFSTIVRKQ